MSQGTLELSSTKFATQAPAGRTSFFCDRRNVFQFVQHFQALAMDEGLLLLKLDVRKAAKPGSMSQVLWQVFRVLTKPRRGSIGAIIEHHVSNHDQHLAPSMFHKSAESYDAAKDEVIWEAARKRKRSSLLIDYGDIISVSIDAPMQLSALAARISLNTNTFGKIALEIPEQPDVGAAIELFESRLADVTSVNVSLNPDTMMYS